MTRKHLYTAPLAFAGLLLSAPALAQEAAAPEAAEAVSGGTAYLQHAAVPDRRFPRDVDGRRRRCSRLAWCARRTSRSVPQEHRAILDCRPDVLGDRLFDRLSGLRGRFLRDRRLPYAMQGVGEADTGTGYSVASDWTRWSSAPLPRRSCRAPWPSASRSCRSSSSSRC